MRTWDTLDGGSPFFYVQSPDEILRLVPTLAPHVANYAVRGNMSNGFQDDPSGFPSFEGTWDYLNGTIVAGLESGRINSEVYESDVNTALQIRTAIFNDIAPKDSRIRGTYKDTSLEYRRDSFTESVASVMRQPDSRAVMMENVNKFVDQSSSRVARQLKKGPIEYDYIVRGGGLAAANVVSTLQETDPKGKILVIDDAEDGRTFGGQFRTYGSIPTFSMNSRIKPVNGIKQVYGLPTHGGDLNSVGMHAALSLPDFVATELANNTDPGDMAAVNIVLSGADILCRPRQNIGVLQFGDETRVSVDVMRNSIRCSNPVIEANGAGTIDQKRIYDPSGNYIFSPADVLRMYGEHTPGSRHKGEIFAGKTVAVGGCGDTAKVVAKLLVGQGPPEAYRGQRMNNLRPERIIWIADQLGQLGTKSAFQAGTRAVYAELGAYLPNSFGASSLINPIAGKVVEASSRLVAAGFISDGLPAPRLEIVVNQGFNTRGNPRMQRVTADHYIGATGAMDPSVDNPSLTIARSLGDIDNESVFGSNISRRLPGPVGKVLVGACAQLNVRSDAGVPENTVSLWATSASVTLAARRMAVETRSRRRSNFVTKSLAASKRFDASRKTFYDEIYFGEEFEA